MYLSGQDDPGTSYDERVLPANSPSEEEDDSDVDGLEGGTSGDSNNKENEENVESPIKSVIGSFFFP